MRAILVSLMTVILMQNSPRATAQGLTPEQIADGWISLFDGETLFGWAPTSKADWKVEDGEIRVSSGEQGFLMTTSDFADYELHAEFRAPATTNSGFFLRTALEVSNPATDCYELNIAPVDNPFPTGSLVGRIKQNLGDAKPWDGQWHTFDVKLVGEEFQVSIDGVLLKPYAGSAPHRGRVALQFREGPVAFRNIRLKPLGLEPMLNGKDLAGWNTQNVESSKFEVVPPQTSSSLPSAGRAGEGGEAGTGADHPSLTLPVEGRGPENSEAPVAKDSRPLSELHVTNGRGILETEASYGDFVMQLDCFVNGDGLNSGVFFRSIPREYADGYESQISNVVVDGDPSKPRDFGTGAIYRRTPARRVVAKDREWFTKTIVADGPHFAVWVNGFQVTDWTDKREPAENPREGKRLEPGTISLQGHDPTTDIRFRNLRIVELPKENDELPNDE